jgi:phage-related tail protein
MNQDIYNKTNKMEIKRFDEFVNESQEIDLELSEQVDWWGMAKASLLGPLYVAHKESPEKVKKMVKGALLGPLLAGKTGQSAIKNMLNVTPAGIIKNMSISASKGDATNFKTSWTAAQKYAAKDLKTLEKAAFQDMKSFGSALKKMGF